MDIVRLDLVKFSGFAPPAVKPKGGVDAIGSFEEILRTSMKQVNAVQMNADSMVQKLALGDVSDVAEVSVAVEKSELALRTLSEVRNKLVDAYQQIARMPV